MHADTYLHTSRLGRGYAWVNGVNVGRYWTQAGPQQALFVPGIWLRNGSNEIVVFEVEEALEAPLVWLGAEPDFSGGRLPRRGGAMLGELLLIAWTRWQARADSHDTFFFLDTLRRALSLAPH